MDIDLHSLQDGHEFEQLCKDVLIRIYPDLKPIDGSGGDEGIDAHIGVIDGVITIWQSKFVKDRLSEKGWKVKIISSLKTAKEKQLDLEKWVLMLAIDFTTDEERWFNTEIIEKNPDIEIEYWNKTKIENELTRHADLVDKYFNRSLLNTGRIIEEAVPFLSGSSPKKAMGLLEYAKKIEKENPEMGIEFNIDSKSGKHSISIHPKEPIKFTINFNSEKTGMANTKELFEHIQELGKRGETFSLTGEDVAKISSKSDKFKDFFPEESISTLEIKPSYLDKVINSRIEIPSQSYIYENIIFKIVKMGDDYVEIMSTNQIFQMNIRFDKKEDGILANLNIKYNLIGKPISKLINLVKLIDNINKGNDFIVRDIDNGLPIIEIINNSIFNIEFDDINRNIINDLFYIQSKTGVFFEYPEEITKDDIGVLQLLISLLKTGKYKVFVDCLSVTFPLKLASSIYKDFNKNGYVSNVKTKLEKELITLFGNNISISNIEYIMPEMIIIKNDELKEKIDREDDEIKIEFTPRDIKQFAIVKIIHDSD